MSSREKSPTKQLTAINSTSTLIKWFKIIGILLLVGWITYYFMKDDFHETLKRTDYSIIETSLNNRRAFNITIRIQDKMEDAQLIAIARNVKEISNTVSDTGIIFFFLPEMVNNNGAWASVKFTPEPLVSIIGLSITDDRAIRNSLDYFKDYIGLWIDNGSSGQKVICIRRDKKYKYVSEFRSPDEPNPNQLFEPLKLERIENKVVFRLIESEAGDYYVFSSNGDLDCYDNQGYINTYKLLK